MRDRERDRRRVETPELPRCTIHSSIVARLATDVRTPMRRERERERERERDIRNLLYELMLSEVYMSRSNVDRSRNQ
jgi:hypothetical protein